MYSLIVYVARHPPPHPPPRHSVVRSPRADRVNLSAAPAPVGSVGIRMQSVRQHVPHQDPHKLLPIIVLKTPVQPFLRVPNIRNAMVTRVSRCLEKGMTNVICSSADVVIRSIRCARGRSALRSTALAQMNAPRLSLAASIRSARQTILLALRFPAQARMLVIPFSAVAQSISPVTLAISVSRLMVVGLTSAPISFLVRAIRNAHPIVDQRVSSFLVLGTLSVMLRSGVIVPSILNAMIRTNAKRLLVPDPTSVRMMSVAKSIWHVTKMTSVSRFPAKAKMNVIPL